MGTITKPFTATTLSNLYFYSLSSSPLNASDYPRKGKLKYHQPHMSSSYDLYGSLQPLPTYPQSSTNNHTAYSAYIPPTTPSTPFGVAPTPFTALATTSTPATYRPMFSLLSIPKYNSSPRRVSPPAPSHSASTFRISSSRSHAASFHPYSSATSPYSNRCYAHSTGRPQAQSATSSAVHHH
jgi:hypothetical protein